MVERLRLPPPEPEPKKKRVRVRRPVNPNGRGRRPRVSNHLSLEQRKAAAKTGELPHQFMLRIMRLGPGKMVGDHELTWEDIQWAAKNAAPFYAARLASIHVKAEDRPPVVIQIDPNKLKDMSPGDLSRMLSALMQASAPTVINGEVVEGGNSEQDIIDTVDADLYERTLN